MFNYTIILFLLNINYFNFHAIIGDKVAAINEQNKRDWEIYDGAKSIGKITPNNIDLEKSIEIGSAAAAIVVTKVGCAPAMPNLNEILEFMKYNKINEGE